jgi:predicted alpha/beta superfamily hydrolase
MALFCCFLGARNQSLCSPLLRAILPRAPIRVLQPLLLLIVFIINQFVHMIKKMPGSVELISFCLLIFSILLPYHFQAQSSSAPLDYSAVKLINTEQRLLHSNVNNQDYEIYISLPDNYANGDSTYPVLYLTDANTYFGLMADITRNLQWGGEMPETIIVGIGYPLASFKTDDERWGKWLAWRMRDFSPTSNQQLDKDFGTEEIKSGGADAFLKFMEQELFPFIEKNYRAKTKDRIFAGFSLGGLFGLYSLFQKPGLFQYFLIGSASIWYDDKMILKTEKSYSSSHQDLTANLFMSAGSLEEEINAGMVRNTLEMNSILKSRRYKSLAAEVVIFEGETHMSAPSSSFQRGLRHFFRK